jgi:hypothetical protein
MGTGQLAFELFSQPLPGFMMLSGRTMAVAAGTGNRYPVETFTTAEYHAAVCGCPAALNLPDNPAMNGRQAGKISQVVISMTTKDFSDGSHRRLLS